MAPTSAHVVRGDRIAIVSPSGPSPEAHIRAGVARIAARYRVAIDERAFAARGYLAGSDDDRANALLDALRDPEVKAIWCTRGGFGATRVLEQHGHDIERALREHRKPIIGFSDITALHTLWAAVGVRSIHAPMIARIGTPDAISDEALAGIYDAIEGQPRAMRAERFWFRRGFSGRSAGGNLSVLAALVGTPYAPQFKSDSVVFLEDVGERPYRVDRMLTQLRSGGYFADVAGFVLGEFKDCGPGPDGATIEEVLLEGLRPTGAPVVVGAPFGHGERCAPFELGAEVRVNDDCSIEWGCAR